MKKKYIVILSAVFVLGIITAASFFIFKKNFFKAVISDKVFLGDDYQKYINKKYNFSLDYPLGYVVQEFQEDDGAETIVFQGVSGEFQIFIAPFEGNLSSYTIFNDLPNLVFEEPLRVIINPDAKEYTEAFIFWSESPTVGKTREVWFARDGYLYEVTARADFDGLLGPIMSSWRFAE